MQELRHAVFVFTENRIVCRVIGFLDACTETIRSLSTVGRRLEQDSRQRRTERECRETAQSDRRGDGDTELGEERTGSTGHEGDGDEHRHEDECTRNNRYRHFAHRVFGSLIGRGIATLHLRHHRLDDHYRIVNHRSDGEHQGKERQNIQRESCHLDHRERAEQRHNDGDGRDKRSLEVLQEEIDDEYDKDDSDNKRLHHIVDSGIEEVIGGLQNRELQAGGHRCRKVLINIVDSGIDLGSIGSRSLIDDVCYAGLTVHAGREAVVQRTEFHIRHIAQMQHIPFVRTQDDGLKLVYRLQTSLVLEVILVGITTLFAERTRGCHHVLIADSREDILRRDAVARHHIGFHPYTQRIGVTQELDRADTRDTQ